MKYQNIIRETQQHICDDVDMVLKRYHIVNKEYAKYQINQAMMKILEQHTSRILNNVSDPLNKDK